MLAPDAITAWAPADEILLQTLPEVFRVEGNYPASSFQTAMNFSK